MQTCFSPKGMLHLHKTVLACFEQATYSMSLSRRHMQHSKLQPHTSTHSTQFWAARRQTTAPLRTRHRFLPFSHPTPVLCCLESNPVWHSPGCGPATNAVPLQSAAGTTAPRARTTVRAAAAAVANPEAASRDAAAAAVPSSVVDIRAAAQQQSLDVLEWRAVCQQVRSCSRVVV